jgi:hypothetical protein
MLKREPKNKMRFTDQRIRRLNIKKHFEKINAKRHKQGLPFAVQDMIWDKEQDGLALLLSGGGSKTFRSYYMLHGKQQSRTIGTFDSMVPNAVSKAREEAANDRKMSDWYRYQYDRPKVNAKREAAHG